MSYVIAFLEGIITFISSCLLPMLPIYIVCFAGGGERSTGKTLKGALGFVTGFTVVFVILGALAGTVGSFLREYQTAVNIVSGAIVIVFGLNFLGIFKLNLFRAGHRSVNTDNMGFFSALLFGMIFSVGWTPCVGAFLGSALMLASQQGHVFVAAMVVLVFSSSSVDDHCVFLPHFVIDNCHSTIWNVLYLPQCGQGSSSPYLFFI